MNSGPSMEERVREELTRMRGEIPVTREPGRSVMARARRGMAATIAGAILATAVVVGGSVAAWNAFGPSGTPAPAATGTGGPPVSVAPSGTESAAVAELRSRPLALPTLPPGGACPATPNVMIRPGPGTGFTGRWAAQRAGVVYLTMAGPHPRIRPSDPHPGGWYGIKDVWVVDANYRGPLLIRGGRIDGPGPMQFQFTPETPMQNALLLQDSPPAPGATAWHWRWSVPTAAFIRTPGCYAYQIDGTTFTTYLLFEATR